MAHRKAGGSAKNLKDSKPKYLGIKRAAGQQANRGAVLVRQRGTKIEAGRGVGLGNDHTLFALRDGVVTFSVRRKTHFDGKAIKKRVIHII